MSQRNLLNKYIIDTSAIFDFWLTEPRTVRPYHVKIHKFRSIWDHISSLVENGTLLVPHCVVNEVVWADQELLDWVKKHKHFFIGHNDCLAELSKIINAFKGYSMKRVNKLTDAYVVSLGMNKGLIVITSEKFCTGTPSQINPQIPNVCDYFSVKWQNLPEFFEAEGL
ncbi:DUF4411 family protein [Candidatus Gottesmanbacteria bacterium]|nr:DUF4411 family protein [Candidatus Gottesmanbacteria bacterium]